MVALASGVFALGAGIGLAGLASAPTDHHPFRVAQRGALGRYRSLRAWPRRAGRGSRPPRGDLAKKLAEKLGVTEDKVTTALKEIRDANKPATRRPSRTRAPGPTEPARDAELAKALAEKLGIDEAKIKTALDEIRAARQAERAAALKTGWTPRSRPAP